MDRVKDSEYKEVKSSAQRFSKKLHSSLFLILLSSLFFSIPFLITFIIFSIFSSSIECKDELKLVKSAYLDETNEFDITVAEAIKILWRDPGSKLSLIILNYLQKKFKVIFHFLIFFIDFYFLLICLRNC